MTLQRLVLDFRTGELVVRALYRAQDGPNPGTKARAREVSGLVREGLRAALRALEGDVTMAGTSGFTTREDVLLATASRVAMTSPKQVKRGA
ncbi:MAG TPA: hypothetical protein VGP38_00515 [Rubrobacter sp.]|nr:hypothetical protein [Rubrobacter sp.]